MKIVKTVNRELTEAEIASIAQFRHYTDGVSFACLRERVLVMLDDEPSKNVEDLKQAALAHMDEALSTHPDMSTWDMDDGYAMVCIPGGVFAISQDDVARHNLGLYLELRGECLDACDAGEVIAVAFEDEDEAEED